MKIIMISLLSGLFVGGLVLFYSEVQYGET
jgi:hypothetical protein